MEIQEAKLLKRLVADYIEEYMDHTASDTFFKALILTGKRQ